MLNAGVGSRFETRGVEERSTAVKDREVRPREGVRG